MNEENQPPSWLTGARVLLLGRAPEVLDTVKQELLELGVDVRGTTDIENAADRFDATEFDLIAFGRGVLGPASDWLKQAFTRQHPQIRFLDTLAPLAVGQILAALTGKDRDPELDLDAYFARIGHTGPRSPTLTTLRALHERHPASIVFENVDILLGRDIDISPMAVDTKLIERHRGGYCFEHNSLFKRALEAIGFDVEGLAARVRWRSLAGAAPRPRTHMALRVMVEGRPWLADVGFGGNVPVAPLRLDTTEPQATHHDIYRVIPFGDGLLVQMQLDATWTSLYELSLEPQLDVDYELLNWFTATHPSSHFRYHLNVARTTSDARYTLADRRFTIRPPGGEVERHLLDSDGIAHVLRDTFGLPVEADWRPMIERAATAND
ncbi:arylamine N-acetyltransferase family protein [Aidingimonas lacisalsi]|uniref:arylamine N-acetyltransferase family protein n=1 Tax=Aidingimonas lacisalsi TaxID=2604086 RepID=UPI0011D1895B|nr:arylamine N-acetyltransferase [Aidingimonas lacisalsi]